MNGHSPEVKAAVMAALLAGQSVSSVAKQYNLPKGTVSDWRRQSKTMGVGSHPTQKRDETLQSIGDALAELLLTEIQTLIIISRESRNPAWIKIQTADALAVFTGVKHDKVIRMIEAFDSSNTNTEAPN